MVKGTNFKGTIAYIILILILFIILTIHQMGLLNLINTSILLIIWAIMGSIILKIQKKE